MPGRIACLYRHPVKGFTPERLDSAVLEARAWFPGDRLYAVENGASGFDPAAPRHIGKTKFTVLANCPSLARARTRYDDASGWLTVELNHEEPFTCDLATEAGRADFAAWLTGFLDPEDVRGPLRVLSTAGAHRFTDSAKGFVSLINLESVRDLERRLGRPIDPLRFRANLYVEGWPAWSELAARPGSILKLGRAEAEVVQPIVRCVATHVDPKTGERDLEIVQALHRLYGHLSCGLYLNTSWGGRVSAGDPAELAAAPPLAPAPSDDYVRAVPLA